MRSHLDKVDKGHKLIITELPNNESRPVVVQAHLPDTYGFATGSEITSPFGGYVSDGAVGKALALAGATARAGIKTKKMFTGSTNPDINVELKFEAFYNAKTEVMLPVANLMWMSVGTEGKLPEDIQASLEALITAGGAVAESVGGLDKNYGAEVNVPDHLGYYSSPNPVRCEFGRSFIISNAFISNVNIRFSRDVDFDHTPLSAEVSLTITPVEPIHKESLIELFSNIGGVGVANG